MHQRKGKKILIYFFLLILVGSINNINFSSIKLKEIDNIKVLGLGDKDNSILLKEIENLNLENIFLINKAKIVEKINSNNLIEKYEIFKRYPSSLDINIDKTKFLAKLNENDKIFIIGSNGKLSKNDLFNNHLPFIFGTPDINEFLYFKEIIDQSNFSYDEVKNLYFYSSKRWDIELNNDIIIKLSKDHPKNSLKFAFEFLHNNDFKDIKIID
ncbi:FtsQ-type POTRA domain-containing protein, partial [Candidatus Pelagibacter sp.]|nr:FtsQ-type POTRA domain-containing protein [Candidatus Pelagibacter sp.]